MNKQAVRGSVVFRDNKQIITCSYLVIRFEIGNEVNKYRRPQAGFDSRNCTMYNE